MAKINKDDLKIGVKFTPCSKCERVETVHGKWVFGKNHGEFVEAECSHCKGLLLVKWYDEIDKYRFCPNCGAKMEKLELVVPEEALKEAILKMLDQEQKEKYFFGK